MNNLQNIPLGREGGELLEGSMFLKPQAQPSLKGVSNYREASLFSVLNAEELLASPKRQQWFTSIKPAAKLSDEFYSEIYSTLINNFAEFMQLIPKTVGAALAGLLDEGLKSGLYALQLYNEAASENHDPAFAYALFSAALMSDIRLIFANKFIIVADADGAFISPWQPFEGNLITKGSHYKIRQYDRPATHLNPHINLLLARQLMPETGFLWIAEDLHLLGQWSAALSGDEEGSGTLGHYLNLSKMKLNRELNPGEGFPGAKITEPAATAGGEAFISWVKQGLADQTIDINNEDAQVHTSADDEDVLLEAALLKDYTEKQKSQQQEKSPLLAELQQQLNYLGLAKLSGDDRIIDQRFSEYPSVRALKYSKAKTKIETNKNNDGKNPAARFFINTNKKQTKTAKAKSQDNENRFKDSIVVPRRLLFINNAKFRQSNFITTQKTPVAKRLAKLRSLIAKKISARHFISQLMSRRK